MPTTSANQELVAFLPLPLPYLCSYATGRKDWTWLEKVEREDGWTIFFFFFFCLTTTDIENRTYNHKQTTKAKEKKKTGVKGYWGSIYRAIERKTLICTPFTWNFYTSKSWPMRTKEKNFNCDMTMSNNNSIGIHPSTIPTCIHSSIHPSRKSSLYTPPCLVYFWLIVVHRCPFVVFAPLATTSLTLSNSNESTTSLNCFQEGDKRAFFLFAFFAPLLRWAGLRPLYHFCWLRHSLSLQTTEAVLNCALSTSSVVSINTHAFLHTSSSSSSQQIQILSSNIS